MRLNLQTLMVAALICLLAVASDLRADDIVVSPDGPFKTVQSAIDSVPDGNKDPRVIVIKPGTYKEHLLVPKNKPFITFKGDDADPKKTILDFDRHSGMDDPERRERRWARADRRACSSLPTTSPPRTSPLKTPPATSGRRWRWHDGGSDRVS